MLNYSDLSINLLAVSPDDRPLVGALRHHPNIFLNVGHGQRANGLAFVSGRAVAEMLDGQEVEDKFVREMMPGRFRI